MKEYETLDRLFFVEFTTSLFAGFVYHPVVVTSYAYLFINVVEYWIVNVKFYPILIM